MANHLSHANLMGLPTELFDDICAKISQSAIVRLGRTCKELNARIQGPLYYHAMVISYKKLSLLQRSLTEAACHDGRGGVISKNIRDLKVFVDTNENSGNWSTAVVLGRMFQSLARYCPRINIKLSLINATCQGQPIGAFGTEVFPRITHLILNTAEDQTSTASNPSTQRAAVVNNSRTAYAHMGPVRKRCGPNKEFWTGLFNGDSFPDLQEIEIIHGETRTWYSHDEPKFGSSDLKGLGRITRLVVSRAPELNDKILMSALSLAMSLKKLELKKIEGLSYNAISKLLQFALPNLTHFTLHVKYGDSSARDVERSLRHVDTLEAGPHEDVHHLCPLIREYGKNIQHLDIFLPYICREVFLTAAERKKLSEAGVNISIGNRYGDIGTELLDKTSIVKILTDYRKALSHAKFQQAVKENIKEASTTGKTKAHNLAEYEEDQKKYSRARSIQQERWTRILRTCNKLCRPYETFEELVLLAGLEEPGITWKLGHETLDVAAICQPPTVAREGKYDELMPINARSLTESANIDEVRERRRGYELD
ncbi:hypothetical protein EDC01DRAFT_355532 [Geopyxis carbonaria]|nr:hypothetical protein EDC01DRAFT_355532 [Geopyxis carbonaria]